MSATLYELFVEPLTVQAFQKALIGGSLVAIVCGVVGCFVILRRMAFLGDAISHSMLAGVTAGYLFMQMIYSQEAHAPAMLLGSILAGVVTVGMVAFVSRVSRIKEDTAIGIMYTGIFAIGGILASYFSHRIHIDLYHFVTGMVLGVDDSDLWMMAIVAAFVLAVMILFFRHFKITTFDPVMAASIGVPVAAIEYLLTTCTSLVVVSAVNIVGVILVVGLLVTPAATAYLLCDRLSRMMWVAALFGVMSVTGGLYLSTWIGNVATGPSIVITSTLLFMLVLFTAPKYGMIADWWRRKTMVPQSMVEDILGCFRYAEKKITSFGSIAKTVGGSPVRIRRALRNLQRQDLVKIQGETISLTEAGEERATRLLRAHRLWETYLQTVGIPEEDLHSQAHILEHVHDPKTVEYLDDKLGHPLRDPHGSEIPEDSKQLAPGAIVISSLMREGRSAKVVGVMEGGLSNADIAKIRVGMTIKAGRRSDDGEIWSFHLEDGQVVQLDHDAADQVTVELGPRSR